MTASDDQHEAPIADGAESDSDESPPAQDGEPVATAIARRLKPNPMSPLLLLEEGSADDRLYTAADGFRQSQLEALKRRAGSGELGPGADKLIHVAAMANALTLTYLHKGLAATDDATSIALHRFALESAEVARRHIETAYAIAATGPRDARVAGFRSEGA